MSRNDKSPTGLDTCGCCEGLAASTPVEVYNRPGLAAVAYRSGTHARFKESMLARLSASDLPALRGLNTRDDDDFAVALIDAWAMVADVLTFYGERIANESYLRTATERGSLLELSRLIGYSPRPGVAASTHLAFEMEDAPGAPRSATIHAGTKVQSLPGQDELPQTFETGEGIEARVEWNELRPRRTKPQKPAFGDTYTYLKGVTTNLVPGDPLFIVAPGRERDLRSEQWEIRRLSAVEPDVEADHTLVRWEEPLGSLVPRVVSPAGGAKVFALRLRASLFGYNAPQYELLPEALTREGGIYYDQEDYADGNLPDSPRSINLDAVYPQVIPDSWIVLTKPDYAECYRVKEALEEAKAAFTIAAKTTRLELSGENLSRFSPRTTTVYAQSEELPLAEYPLGEDEPVSGGELTLDHEVEGLAKGRLILVTGTTTDGEPAVEAMTLKDAVTSGDGLTVLRFEESLTNSYPPDDVVVYANVAPATHGETREEILGSGEAGQAYRSFALREAPLTYVRSATPGGAQTTLAVRVNDVLWREVPSLHGQGAKDRVYVTYRDEEDRTTIQFGDGHTGARPPTGQENVRATYRKGIGAEGMVEAGQLSLLLTRPLGVRGVSNPGAAAGAADPEPRDEVRRNAPLTVLALERIVSLRDYEDFALAYAGISKALATPVRDGEARGVHVTVAGPGGAKPDAGLISDLSAAMRAAGDPHLPLFVEPYRPVRFRVEANVEVDADFLPEKVLAAVEGALRARFSFEARSFGQPVALSEVVAVAQEVPGVVAVDVNALYRECEREDVEDLGRQCTPGDLNPRLDARAARSDRAAELLMLNPDPLGLGEMP